ncbi:CHAD domain-containing protein [Streptomyces sp. CAU 1734]|uniref:CHAD domain-containing protein n=1 Tax=Streptomyces sp. CAU 1734 TaxID=3140360 RepID=UPI00326124C7
MPNPDVTRLPARGRVPAPDRVSGAGRTAGGPGLPGPPATAALTAYLNDRAAEFLRGLRLHEESGGGAGPEGAAAEHAARALRMSSRRISGTLHTFRPLLDPVWADRLRTELNWLSAVLAEEHACLSRLNRLLDALGRLSGAPAGTGGHSGQDGTGHGPAGGRAALPRPAGGRTGRGPAPAAGRGTLTAGAARAAALLERRLDPARTRAHSAALRALGSARFHALADSVAVLASEIPLVPVPHPLPEPLPVPAAEERLLHAVAALPPAPAGRLHHAEALMNGLAIASSEAQDAPWHRVRRLLRLHRYAGEVLAGEPDPAMAALRRAGALLDRHRDAAEAAAAAAEAARTPRIAPATAYALGILHADQRHEVEAVRFAFHELWARIPGHGRTGRAEGPALPGAVR